MATDYDAVEERKPRRWVAPLILILLAFAAGAAAMGYVLTHWRVAADYLAKSPPVQQPVVATPAPVPLAAVPRTPQQLDAMGVRVAELEARIGQIDQRADSAVGNADRAEGLLVAFAARRALDRGVPLGYIEALLRERFGEAQPQAVATILAAGRQPVTLDRLQTGLDDLGPMLMGVGPDVGWWEAFRRELAGLIVLRRADSPSPEPAERFARARRQLDAGHVGAALAEVARMPGAIQAQQWMAQARRYAAAHDALDAIETAALVDQRPQLAPAAPAQPAPQVTSPRTL